MNTAFAVTGYIHILARPPPKCNEKLAASGEGSARESAPLPL